MTEIVHYFTTQFCCARFSRLTMTFFRKILFIRGHQTFFQCYLPNFIGRMKGIKIIFILENKTIEYPMFCCLCYSSEQEQLKRKNTRGQNVNLDDYDQARVILYPVQSWSGEKWSVISCDMACSG